MSPNISDKLRESRFTNWIIFGCGLGLFVLIVISFFFNPLYEKGVALGLFAFSNAFSGALAFKFGVTQTPSTTRVVVQPNPPDQAPRVVPANPAPILPPGGNSNFAVLGGQGEGPIA